MQPQKVVVVLKPGFIVGSDHRFAKLLNVRRDIVRGDWLLKEREVGLGVQLLRGLLLEFVHALGVLFAVYGVFRVGRDWVGGSSHLGTVEVA